RQASPGGGRGRDGPREHQSAGGAHHPGDRLVNILMIAPQPVFSPRGTPISVVNRCRALSALGHTVDLVTYPLGENVAIDGVRWLRAPRIPGIRSVKIGPSAAKLPLDAAVLAKATARAVRGRKSYDVV